MTQYKIPKAWSLSALGQFEGCPAQYEWARIMKKGDGLQQSPAIMRGIEIHQKCERFLLGDIYGIPKPMEKFESEFRNLKKAGALAETDLAITSDWTGTTWNDWDNVWCRAKADAVVVKDEVADVIDFKTGKVREHGYQQQCELYSLLIFAHYPYVQKTTAELWFLDHHVVQSMTYERSKMYNTKRKLWTRRANMMLKAKTFEKTPGKKTCQWCIRRTDKGGDCNEWKKI